MIADYPQSLVAFQIHTGGAGPVTPWGTDRAIFYNLIGIPDVWVDGVLEQAGSVGTDPLNYNNMLGLMNQRLAVPTDVTLELYAHQLSGMTYRLTAIVGIETGGTGKTMRLHVVSALSGYPESSDARYDNGVMQGLEALEFSLSPGQSVALFQDIIFDDTSWSRQDDIRIIAWLQDMSAGAPSEVYQAEVIPWPFPVLATCPADVNGDEVVNVMDVLAVLAVWSQSGVPEDINGDGVVDVLDLLEVLAAWGPCPVVPTGACCMWDGACADMMFYECMMTGPAEWHEGEECATFTCPPWPTGACCVGLDCIATNTEYECFQAGGTWHEGEDCATYICPHAYCDASGGCDEHIARVQMGDIDNSTTCTHYGDYSNLSTTMQIGQACTCAVTNGNPLWIGDQLGAWADWNNDGDFDDPGETVVASIPGVGPYVFDVIPPAGTLVGNVRFRIRITWNTTPLPCGADTYGEVEDYTITVTP